MSELSEEIRRTTAEGMERKQRITSKLQGYGEGVVHGWETAAAKVAEATNGLFTLQEPSEVTEWRRRLKRSVVEDYGRR